MRRTRFTREGIGVRVTACGKGVKVEVFVRNSFVGKSETDDVGWQASKKMKKSQDKITR